MKHKSGLYCGKSDCRHPCLPKMSLQDVDLLAICEPNSKAFLVAKLVLSCVDIQRAVQIKGSTFMRWYIFIAAFVNVVDGMNSFVLSYVIQGYMPWPLVLTFIWLTNLVRKKTHP